MASLRDLLLALLFAAFVRDSSWVEATIWDTTYFTWGAQHSQITSDGNDIQLAPNSQGMWLYSSLWNANDWATEAGRIKTDWSKAPFKASYRNFSPRACTWLGPASIAECAAYTPSNWWTSPDFSQLSNSQQGQMKWVRDNYMTYDYCKDYMKFNWNMPPECYKPQY